MATETATLRREVERLAPWFHDLDLGGGVRTAPDHPLGSFLEDIWRCLEGAFPADMTGRTVLDIGCNAGFYAFKLLERGATVTAVDHDSRYLEQAALAARVLGFDLELVELDVYDLDRIDRTFDDVLFLGVFYHLRHPLYALEKVVARVGRRLYFQSMVRGSSDVHEPTPDYPITERDVFEQPGFPAMYFVEHAYAGDPTNWWVPNEAAVQALLRSVGMPVQQRRGEGLYVCESGERP